MQQYFLCLMLCFKPVWKHFIFKSIRVLQPTVFTVFIVFIFHKKTVFRSVFEPNQIVTATPGLIIYLLMKWLWFIAIFPGLSFLLLSSVTKNYGLFNTINLQNSYHNLAKLCILTFFIQLYYNYNMSCIFIFYPFMSSKGFTSQAVFFLSA